MSVVVLTLNEQINLRDCLGSCVWSDDVHVLDSGSMDGTAGLARELGAKVWTNPFTSFGAQRNWAIDHIELKHDWVFHLDADERFTEPLVKEMELLLGGGTGPAEAGFYVASQMVLMGGWIKRASGYPAYQMRLFNKGRMRFTDYGHGQREDGKGPIGRLREPYVHLNFSKGLDDWFERHNRYSTLEAKQIVAGNGGGVGLGGLLSGDRTVRRRALKHAAGGLPCRPTLRRLHTLFVQGGILDGRAGWMYAELMSAYEGMIGLKVRAMKAEKTVPPGRDGGGL